MQAVSDTVSAYKILVSSPYCQLVLISLWEVVAQWLKCWPTDWKVASSIPSTAKLPLLGP